MKKNKIAFWPAAFLAQSTGINNNFFRRDIGSLFGGATSSPVKAENLGQLIMAVISLLLIVAGSVAVVFLMVGGYRYVMASGNEDQTESAKKTITSAIVGLVIIVAAFVIVRLIINILLKAPYQQGI